MDKPTPHTGLLNTPSTMNSPILSPNQQMSSALKDRLKRCGRWHPSPSTESAKSSSALNYKTPIRHIPCKLNQTSFMAVEANVNSSNMPDATEICANVSTPKGSLKRTYCGNSMRKNARFKSRMSGFTSPRMKVEEKVEDCANITEKDTIPEVDKHGSHIESTSNEKVSHIGSSQDCSQQSASNKTNVKTELEQSIKEKEEVLRKLNLVKMYRTKNDLTQLQTLIDRWRGVAQQAVQELCELSMDPKPTQQQVIDHFQINHKLIGYDDEEEGFTS